MIGTRVLRLALRLLAPARRPLALLARAAASGAFLASCSGQASPTYLRRFIFWSPSSVEDWRRFPSRPIDKAEQPTRYPEDPSATARLATVLREVTYSHDGVPRTVALDQLLVETGTTAFIIVKDGVLLRETYLNGHRRDSMTRAFSVSKSLTSALIGVALDEGRLQGLDDPMVRYLPELRSRGYDGITLRHLLLMAGGLRFSYGRLPWRDSPLLYWHPDIRGILLGGPPLVAPPGQRFVYSDYSTALLGLVLERASGTTISRYLEQHLWKRLGAEYDASWSLDHEDTGLECTASGFNARAIDLVKLGSLYLNRGRWGAAQILPEAWVSESVTPLPAELPGHPEQELRERVFYKFGWWGHVRGEQRTCFFANGYRGQLIYVCPEQQLVIARFGKELGSVGTAWPMLLQAVADRLR
jgi:CubicO group peptidase (beta-lactamase class C family)